MVKLTGKPAEQKLELIMQKRPFGQTDEMLSIIGFGGILVTNTEQSEANQLARYAFDQGINYYDVAPAYGNAEERLGPAICDFRSDIFLACKTGKRSKVEALSRLDNFFPSAV